jgi:glutathione synthase
MSYRIGVLMDPIEQIKTYKDSTFAMLLEAQRRGHEVYYLTDRDLALREGVAYGRCERLHVKDDRSDWFTRETGAWRPLADLDAILLRKDPPVDAAFMQDTLVMDRAEAAGVLMVNRPSSLRDCNEKLYAGMFAQCTPASVVSRDQSQLKAFVLEHGLAVAKVLDAMGGSTIFRCAADDPNINVILETVTREGRDFALVQRFLPEIVQGDKRILLIDGVPVPYALARIPQGGEFRGNMARGGKAVGVPMSERDHWICEQIAPDLRRRGLIFVGIDVIGDYLTEINVTSPTGIRELDAAFGLNIAGLLFDHLERVLAAR